MGILRHPDFRRLWAADLLSQLGSRLSATMSFVNWGAAPVGSLLGGALGTAFGLHTTLWIAGLGTLAGNAFLYFSPLRTLRAIPAEEVSPR